MKASHDALEFTQPAKWQGAECDSGNSDEPLWKKKSINRQSIFVTFLSQVCSKFKGLTASCENLVSDVFTVNFL